MRAVFAGILSALAVVVAGCGGSETTGSAKATESSASIAPVKAVYFVSINSDLDSDQWQKADDLVGKFPDGHDAVADIRKDFEKESGVDFDRDVRPTLGPTIDIVGLDFSDRFVGLTKPADEAKFDAFVRKANAHEKDPDEKLYTRKIKGWTAFSDKPANLDRFEAALGGRTLADDNTFTDAVSGLPDETLATFFVRGSAVTKELREYVNELSGGLGGKLLRDTRIDWISGALSAKSEGALVEFGAKAKVGGESSGEAGKPKLLDEVPADALGVIDIVPSKSGRSDIEKALRSNPALDAPELKEFQRQLGISIRQLAELFSGEMAFYARRDAPIPEFTLVTAPPDADAAVARVDRLARAVTKTAPGARLEDIDVDGVKAKELSFKAPLSLVYAALDGKLVLTTTPDGIRGLKKGSKLTDDDAFKDARDAAETPDKTAVFSYIDLPATIRVIENYARAEGGGVPTEVDADLRPLSSFVLYATNDGDEHTVKAFVGIK